MTIPRFLRPSGTIATKRGLDKTIKNYRPLLGTRLIDIAVMLNWYRPLSRRRWPDIFSDDDFRALTGLPDQEEDDMEIEDDSDGDAAAPRRKVRPTDAVCRNLLKQQREKLQKLKLSGKLPLFTNSAMLADLLGLSDADQAVLAFGAVLEHFTPFKSAISHMAEKTSNLMLCQILARLTGIPWIGNRRYAASAASRRVILRWRRGSSNSGIRRPPRTRFTSSSARSARRKVGCPAE